MGSASKTMTFVSVTSGGNGRLGKAYLHTPFMKKALHITERKRGSNIQHYCKSDDVWTGFKVAKRRLFCHPKMLQSSPARLMSLTSFSPGLLRVPIVCLMFHSSVVIMSNKHSLSKYRYLDPRALTSDIVYTTRDNRSFLVLLLNIYTGNQEITG